MVRVSYDQKPYRRGLIEAFGARVVASPSEETNAGRAILAEHPDSTGSLGIAISEAVEAAAPREDTKYSLGSVLNHVLMHQTVIGEEALLQLETAEDYPDVVIGCTGGGSNFSGLSFPFIGRALREGSEIRVIAVEPAACPSLTKGTYAFDFGDTGHLTPLVKMHTLGSTFVPPPFHAGGLRYHGMAPMVSHLHELGLIEARAYTQTEVFAAGVEFARARGHPPRARGEPRCQGRDRRGDPLSRGRRLAVDPLQPLRARPLRHAGVHRLLRGQARRPCLFGGRGRDGACGAAGSPRLRGAGWASGALESLLQPHREEYPVAVKAGLAIAVVAAGWAVTAAMAAPPSISVAPTPVRRGHTVVVKGSADGCTVGNTVTLISRAFSHAHDFAGLPAVLAKVRAGGTFRVSTRIPSARKPARYTITARCGGGNLGVSAQVRVLA